MPFGRNDRGAYQYNGRHFITRRFGPSVIHMKGTLPTIGKTRFIHSLLSSTIHKKQLKLPKSTDRYLKYIYFHDYKSNIGPTINLQFSRSSGQLNTSSDDHINYLTIAKGPSAIAQLHPIFYCISKSKKYDSTK